jgi:pyruvate/2-oxoglutarate dehydrogenase complex dihydrolipoamide dehydrogenase (E3) component
VGCVPSKTLLRSARAVAEIRRAAALGVQVDGDPRVDFGAVMARMRAVRARISREDSVERYRDELGVDVFLGEARFAGPDSVGVDGKTLRFRRAVIATGGRALAPPIEGLTQSGYLTNETVFSLTERPPRLAVIGAGPIGCELAQAFRRLGSQVALFEIAPRILIREDADAAEIVRGALVREGVRLELGCRLTRVEKSSAGKLVHYETGGVRHEAAFDEILVGAGRAPNVEGLELEAAGVRHEPGRGVVVDAHLRTSNPRVFAAGDVALSHKFTHAADAAAKLVVRNALFPFGRQRMDALVMPWCTYTDPEVAHVGLYEHEARERGVEVDTYQIPLERVNRAVLDAEEEGFVKVHVRRGTDRIVGATIVATHAGEMISEIGLAMVAGLGLGRIASVIHPYPTQAEGIKAAANAFLRTRLTPLARRALGLWLRLSL